MTERSPSAVPAGQSSPAFLPMVTLGELRVRLDTIRLYGITREDCWKLKVYQPDTSPPKTLRDWLFPEKRWRWQGLSAAAAGPEDWQGQRLVLENGTVRRAREGLPGQPEDLIHEKQELLYVVTDQGETLRFFAGQSGFDIREKRRELDGYLLGPGQKNGQCL